MEQDNIVPVGKKESNSYDEAMQDAEKNRSSRQCNPTYTVM